MKSGLPAAAPAPSFDDPLGMLFACHRRIERQLATLARLQRHLPEHGCDDDARAAARAILKYFDEAAPNHHADEEQSLFPRLAALRPRGRRALMAPLLDEHELLADNWNRLRPLLSRTSPRRRRRPAAGGGRGSRRRVCAPHRARGQRAIPLAGRSSTPAALAAIGREMAERRGVSFDAKTKG